MAASCVRDVEAAFLDAVTALCPGFRARGEPSYTETSMLLRGALDGRAVIAKYPVDRRPFWLARARHEITVYRALPALAPLPVTVPDIVAADPMHPLIVMTALDGEPVHPHRYPNGTIHTEQLGAVLSLLAHVHAWRPAMSSALPYDDDYPSQLAAVRGPEISDIEHSCAVELYTAICGRLGVEIQHGDAHLGNVIRQPDGRLALIDLEFTAWRWPSYDLAMLWVLLGDSPSMRKQLISRIGRAAERHAAFWCSTVLVCLREITSHRRGPQNATRRTRAERLQCDLVVALDHVETYHRQIVWAQTHHTTTSGGPDATPAPSNQRLLRLRPRHSSRPDLH
ncbi:MAG: aminoglycoside phosphotransferase family protein [Pseudonocardiaceae bacterium]